MRRLLIFPLLTLLLLSGCSSSPLEMPDGLSWRAEMLLEDDLLLAAAVDYPTRQNVPVLDVTAQIENGTITLTDHADGTTYEGTVTPSWNSTSTAAVYTLSLSSQPPGYAVYGFTEYQDGSQEGTLYLVSGGKTLYLTAPLPEA